MKRHVTVRNEISDNIWDLKQPAGVSKNTGKINSKCFEVETFQDSTLIVNEMSLPSSLDINDLIRI